MPPNRSGASTPKVALPPILPAPRGGTGAQQASQQQKTVAGAYRQTVPVRPVAVPPSGIRIPAAFTQPRSPHAPPSHTDATSSGPGYGSKQAAAFKQTAAYRNAIVQTFLHQPKPQAQAIVKGALTAPSYEGNLVLKYIKDTAKSDPFSHTLDSVRSGGGPLGALNHFEGALTDTGHFLAGLIGKLPSSNNGTPVSNAMQATAGGATPADVAKNFGKDLVNLPAEVGPSIAIPAGQALSGHPGKALQTLAQPYVQAFEHPQQALEQHPLNTYLLAGGPVHGAAALADRGVRAVVGKPADLQRPSIQLTGNLTKERPNLSRSPIMRNAQKSVERSVYKPSDAGGIVPRSESLRSKQIRAGVSQRVGMNERIRRVEVALQERAHSKAVLASKPRRAAGAVKSSLRYNPAPTLIKGASVLALIASGVIRRPETAVRDLAQHLQRVEATRHDLADFPKALAQHDAYVKSLRAELGRWKSDKNLQRNLRPAFAASDRHAPAYAPLEAQAHDYGHFGKDVSKDMLERRVLTPIVHEHMPGARFDPEKRTMVLDTPTGERVLTTAEMRAFAAKESGGRALSYTSHQAPKGDSAFYVSGQKFPAKAVQRNTMFAFRHGLTDPSHEALLQGLVHMQGVVSAHKSMGRLLGLLTEKRQDGGYWRTFQEAKRDAPAGYRPVNVGRIHGYSEHASPNDATNAASIEHEALAHSLDLNARLQPSEQAGKWGLIHTTAVDQLRKHENQISPNALLRGFRGTTGQFRKVALGTSAKHIPGVIQENLIRDIASGVFIHHWFAERNVFKAAEKINPELARERRIEQAGGQVSGATRALATRQVSRHFEGTAIEGPLKGFEAFMRAPGPRQLSTAWNAWLRFAIDGTKRYLEESHQRAAVGKQLLNEFGGLMRLQGDAARVAAEKGYLPDVAARRLRAGTERMFGHWTDMTPETQMALMVSPFGMWWVNSVRWLARLPVDHPVGTSLLAAANTGTEKERQRLGFDMFAPNHLPLYEQGGIPNGKTTIAQNYYSPFGVANDPLETAQSLLFPTLLPQFFAGAGDNWLGRQMKSPQHPHGGETNPGQRAAVIVNSVLGMLIPLYQKAQTIAQGGASSYDTSTLWQPETKGKNPGVAAGVSRALNPVRTYKNIGDKGAPGSKAKVPGFSGGGSGGAVAVPGFSGSGSGGAGGVKVPGF